jgi:hypothetical protein
MSDTTMLGIDLTLGWLLEDDASHHSDTDSTSEIVVDIDWHYEAEDNGILAYSRKENDWISSGESIPLPIPKMGAPSDIKEVYFNEGTGALQTRTSTSASLVANLASVALSLEVWIISRKSAQRERDAWNNVAQEISRQQLPNLASVVIKVDYDLEVDAGTGKQLWYFQRITWTSGKTREEARNQILGPAVYGTGILDGPPNRIRLVEIYPVGEPSSRGRSILRSP